MNAQGEVVTTAPDPMVDDYYPLYIDEGELTFDKTGKLLSPKNVVSYESTEGVSVDIDINFSASTQFAQPFRFCLLNRMVLHLAASMVWKLTPQVLCARTTLMVRITH